MVINSFHRMIYIQCKKIREKEIFNVQNRTEFLLYMRLLSSFYIGEYIFHVINQEKRKN